LRQVKAHQTARQRVAVQLYNDWCMSVCIEYSVC